MRYHLRHLTFSTRFAWFWAIVNGMPCVTVKFINDIYIPFFFKKMMVTRGNPLQIAQNQANLRENTWQRVLRRVQVMATRFIMV